MDTPPVPPSYYQDVEGAYDRLAPMYDDYVGMNPVAARAKPVAMGRLQDLAQPGSRLIDIGCGTGTEAVHLSRRGYHVVGFDASQRMVEIARVRSRALPAGGGSCEFEVGRASQAGDWLGRWGTFDAAYSFYAVLNLEPELKAAIRGVASLLPSGAPFVVGLLNPTVLFEILAYPAALNFKGYRKAAARPVRLKVARGSQDDVSCYLYSTRSFARIVGGVFELVDRRAVHLFLPPPDEFILRWPVLVRGFNRIEPHLEGRWPWRELGYFSLLTFRRTDREA